MADEAPRPWTQVAVRSEKDYRIFRARTLDVLDPRNGAPYVRTVIDAPDWVNVVALTPDHRLVLVRQFRYGTDDFSLEIPGGIIEAGEDCIAAGVRELREEFRVGQREQCGSEG